MSKDYHILLDRHHGAAGGPKAEGRLQSSWYASTSSKTPKGQRCSSDSHAVCRRCSVDERGAQYHLVRQGSGVRDRCLRLEYEEGKKKPHTESLPAGAQTYEKENGQPQCEKDTTPAPRTSSQRGMTSLPTRESDTDRLTRMAR